MRESIVEVVNVRVVLRQLVLPGSPCDEDLVVLETLGLSIEQNVLPFFVNPLDRLLDDFDVGFVQEVGLHEIGLILRERSHLSRQDVCVFKATVRTAWHDNDLACEACSKCISSSQCFWCITKDDIGAWVKYLPCQMVLSSECWNMLWDRHTDFVVSDLALKVRDVSQRRTLVHKAGLDIEIAATCRANQFLANQRTIG
jgi:hypothetical protein